MNIPSLSVRNPVTTFMTFMAAIVIGLVCFMQLPVDLFPKMDIPAITVATSFGGASPSDVESKVTEVLERSLGTVPELKHITSNSREGMSLITLQFEWETDLDARANDVRDSIAMAKIFLPEDVDEPRVFKLDIGRFPIMVYGITASESYPDIEKILEDRVADPLKRIPGVAAVTVQSPLHRQVNINVDRERLASYGLSLQQVIYAVNRNNADTPAGNIETGLTDYPVRVPAECKDIKTLASLVMASRNGTVVRLSDVAEVEDGFQELSQHVTINDGMGAILMIQKQSSANSVDVARAVQKRLAEVKPRLPPDIRLINIMDMSEDIERMLSDLSGTLLQGGILAMLVVLLFLREWRSTLVIGLTIPFSLILALIVNFFAGYTINMMSMFGMIIAVGRVIDDAIVVLENIARHREMGERPDEGSIYGASEVAMAITASTLTAVCIFLPIVFVKGLTGVFFREFAIVVTVTLLASLFSALTLTPMLSSTLMRGIIFKKGRGSRFFQASGRVFDRIASGYAALLGWSLGHRRTVVILSLCIFASSLAFLPFVGSEFMPEEDRAMIQGMAYLPVGARVAETQRAL
ncbi:MAG: efflux RND transporter permease subunit, partial [bacterium]